MKTAKGVAVYRQPQQLTLSMLFDFYEANPHSQYTLKIENYRIRTNISTPKSVDAESQENSKEWASGNLQQVDNLAKRTIGLFSNIVKNFSNIKVDKPQSIQQIVPSQQKKEYQFYFNELQTRHNEISPSGRGISTKRVKQKATGIAQLHFYKNNQVKIKENENPNFQKESTGEKTKVSNINHNQANYRIEETYEPFRQLNFSFQQINQRMEQNNKQKQSKQLPNQTCNNNILEISSIHNQLVSPKQGECIPVSLQLVDQRESIKQNDNSKFDELGLLKKQVLSPIPHKVRHQFKANTLTRPNIHNLSLLSKQEISVEGAKKTESRLYRHQQKHFLQPNDPKDIQIDFDLDLNFI